MTPAIRRVILVSGIQGSGKTTHATRLLREFAARFHRPPQSTATTYSFATDEFWELAGPYRVDQTRWKEAHGWNLRRFIETLQAHAVPTPGENIMIGVHNVFTSNVSLAPYIEAAQAYGFEVQVVRMVVSLDLAVSRNVHNVPSDQIARTLRYMEPIHPFWRRIYSEVKVT